MILQKKYLACSEVPVFNLTNLKLDQVICSTHYIITSEEHPPESLEAKLCGHIQSKCVYRWDGLVAESPMTRVEAKDHSCY
jgi:hypothetical protein